MTKVIRSTSRSVRAGLLAASLLAGACAEPAPRPLVRTSSSRYFNLAEQPQRPVVVMGYFDDPDFSTVRWRDIGTGMTDALSREMRAQGVYDAWINARVAREVRSILEGPPSQRPRRFAQVADENPDIRYILIGKVTDFQHLGEPASRRSSIFGGGADDEDVMPQKEKAPAPFEAIVAIDFSIVDIHERRAIMSDHVAARVDAGYQLSRELYRDMAFGSYRFWNTPLGKASQRTILEVMGRIDELPIPDQVPALAAKAEENAEPAPIVPSSTVAANPPPTSIGRTVHADDDMLRAAIRVERQIDPRKLRVVAGLGSVLREGQTLYVSRYDASLGALVAVRDRDTGRPLRARVVEARYDTGTALLLGLKPETVNLRGAVLTVDRAAMPPSGAPSGISGPSMAGASDIPMR